MVQCNWVQLGINPRTVIRGWNSQISNDVGVHWARISFDRKHLDKVDEWVSHFWGKSDTDGRGLWSYDYRKFWASGVGLHFDAALERSLELHRGRITLDCPGSALDELSAPDLVMFLEGCYKLFDGKCVRLDVFFDDHARIISPCQMQDIVKSADYSGFRKGQVSSTFDLGRLEHDEVRFGRRGQQGSGKYLRTYDKNLESKGEKNCIRWELELTKDKAHKVFTQLAETSGDIEAFATLCGAVVGGSIKFVHRTADKNVGRLDVYDFWSSILERIGNVAVRVEKKVSSVTGKIEWTKRQVAPNLACLQRCFKTQKFFFNWLFDVIEDGDSKMSFHNEQLACQNEKSLSYHRQCNTGKQESDYVDLVCT